MNKKLLLSLGTITSLTSIATPLILISCGANTSKTEEVKPVAPLVKLDVNQNVKSVEDLILEENPAKDNVWHADSSNSIVDALEQMNNSMHIFFPKKLSELTPFEFAKWLVDIYNHNGSGKMNMIVDYKGKQDTVVVDFKQPLLDLLTTFKDAHINEATPRGTITSTERSAIVNKMGGVLQLMGIADYAQDMFNTTFFGLLGVLGGNNKVAEAMFPLMMPFPDSTLKVFTKIIDIFKGMATGFTNSPVANEWAKDHSIETDFKKIDHIMLREIMKRAI